MDQVFGWCFIGCGKLANIVAEQILASGRHRIVSVYGRNAERCTEFGRKHHALACHTAEEAMRMPGVEGVYIVTTHTSHYEYSMQALEAGLPVLCEKPLTVRARDAYQLAEKARSSGLYFAEAMWTWFAPEANQVKAWLDAGEFGELTRFELNCRCNARGYAPRVTDPHAAGGAILDMGVYALTHIHRLFGKPDRILCRGILGDGIDWEEEVVCCYGSDEQRMASISIRDPEGKGTLIIEGTNASMTVNRFHHPEQVVLQKKDGSALVCPGGCTYLNEFDIAANEIRSGLTESRYVPLQVTLDVMDMIDECRRQMGLVYPFENNDNLSEKTSMFPLHK